VEEALNELEDIHRISSEVRDGLAVVGVEFEFNTEADEKYDEVVQKVNSIRNTLPDEILQLDMWQWSITDMNMMQLALLSPSASFAELEDAAEVLQERIEKIKNIRKVEFYGLPGQEIHIHLDFEKMAMVNTSMDHIVRAVESNNVNIPGGEMKLGPTSLSVKSSGSFQNLDEIRNCVVNSFRGRLIYLRDLARVEYGYEDRNHLVRYGARKMNRGQTEGHRCIFIGISQKEGLNVLATAEELTPVIEAVKADLDEEMELEDVYNQPATVRDRINGFMSNLLQGMLLVALVIFVSLGFRSSILVAMAIPLSLTIVLGFVNLAGFGLQQISIAGLVVVLGMLVDNSIVMVENISRFIQMGHNRREASILAASEIGCPVIPATLTSILAIVPIAAMPEQPGEFIKSLPVTIMITLTVSLLIALTFTPMITSSMFREREATPPRARRIPRLLKWIIENPFRSSLRLALKRPWITLILALIYLAGSAFMFRYVGISFFPKAQQPNLMIQATLPEGTDLEHTDQLARYMESVLDTMAEVRYYATNVGHGNPRIYYNVFPRRFDKRFAEIYVELYTYDPESFPHTLSKLREAFQLIPGARIRVNEF